MKKAFKLKKIDYAHSVVRKKALERAIESLKVLQGKTSQEEARKIDVIINEIQRAMSEVF